MVVSRSGIRSCTYFRGTNWQVDINLPDAFKHLDELNLKLDMQVILNYFTYFLFVDTDKLAPMNFQQDTRKSKME